MTTLVGPYASAAHAYRDAGWLGVLPLPTLSKSPPPDGFTGHHGPWPTDEQIHAWANGYGEGNLAVRVPSGVIGIDVDHYGEKRGADILAELEAQWGALPPTWVSTSRPWPSGIRLFRVPMGQQFQTVIPGGIEVVQHHHRYMVAWPSVHPDTGGMYQWVAPDGDLAGRPPDIEDLPELPLAWVEGLSRQWATGTEVVDNGPVAEHREERWSMAVHNALERVTFAPGGRHDAATAGAMGLARLEQLGHPGATTALDVLGERFVAAVVSPGVGQRSPASAQREWAGPGGILPSARERARTSPAAAEPYIDPSWIEAWVQENQERRLALGLAPGVGIGNANTRGTGPQPVNWEEFWRRERRTDDWAIPTVVPAGRLVTVWAARKTGKSLFVLDIAAAAATGRPIMGGLHIDPIDVVYLDMEMTEDDLEERLTDLGYGPDADLSRFHYYLLPTLPPLDSEAGGVALMRIVERHRPSVVVIDTMARVVDGEENSADTYRAFYRATGMRLKQAGVALLRLDHAGKQKDKGERGSSAKGDDVDVSWELREVGGGEFLLKRSYTRVSWVPEAIKMRRETDPLRHNAGLAAGGWPSGTAGCAAHLDDLELPLDVTVSAAITELRRHDLSPRSKQVVSAALRYRREHRPTAVENPGSGVGTVLGTENGQVSEPSSEPLGTEGKSPGRTAEPSPEPPGTDSCAPDGGFLSLDRNRRAEPEPQMPWD